VDVGIQGSWPIKCGRPLIPLHLIFFISGDVMGVQVTIAGNDNDWFRFSRIGVDNDLVLNALAQTPACHCGKFSRDSNQV